MAYLEELETLQTWIKQAVGLNSLRLSEAPPKLARPVILWEPAHRRRDRNVDRYVYVKRVRQYGKLYVKSLDQLLEYQDVLITDLENKQGVLPINVGNSQVGKLKAVDLEFQNTDSLDVPFTLTYEATYTRPRPTKPPAPRHVGIRLTVNGVKPLPLGMGI